MNFLFVHEVNWLEKVTYEIHDIPELLSLAGYSVTFIDYPEILANSPRKNKFDLRTTKSPGATRAHKNSKVNVLTPGGVAPEPLRRVLASITFIPLFWKTVKRQKIDVVVLYGVPTNGWQTVVLAKLLKVPVIFRAIDIAHLLRPTVFKPIIKFAEKYIYRNVDHISTHNVALRNYCVELGADPENISVDFPMVDIQRFAPENRKSELALNYGIQPDQKIVFFRGTLYRFAGIEKFVELSSKYLRQNSDVCLLIVGSGEAREEILQTISKAGLTSQIKVIPFVEYDKLVSHICLADVSINTFIPSLVTNCALPGRVLQSMACGVPVVSTKLEGMMSYSQNSNAVIYRDLDETFIDAVAELLSDSAKRKTIGQSGRSLVISKGTWQDFIVNFVLIAERIVSTK